MRGEHEHRARAQRARGAIAVLRLVHAEPGITRSEVARRLDLGSGSATEIVARLRARRLLTEVGPAGARPRGRPSLALVAHPEGPLVGALEISHAGWRVAAVELGGAAVDSTAGRHARRDATAVVEETRAALRQLHRARGGRIRALAVSVPGTVVADRVVLAATLGWRDVGLGAVVPRGLSGVPLLVGNDATLAGLAEARRGVASGVARALYLTIGVGLGGVELVDGRPVAGATGGAGEFGHMPFGDPGRRCPCGATGCWDLEVDGRAMARSLGRRAPRDPLRFAQIVVEAARGGRRAETLAVTRAARALGRGTGALVNALDPELVVYGGLGADLLGLSPRVLRDAYRGALMRHRRRTPPTLCVGTTGEHGSLVGASEAAFDAFFTTDGLEGWDRALAQPAPTSSPSSRQTHPSSSQVTVSVVDRAAPSSS